MVKAKETPKEENKEIPGAGTSATPAGAGGGGATPLADKKPKSEKIEVDKDTLQAVLDKQKDQDAQIQKLTDENKRLEYSADKSRLSLYDSKNATELIHTYRVGVWNGKYVMGWKTEKDDSLWDADRKVFTYVQITKLFLDEGVDKDPSDVSLDMLEASRGMKKVSAELVKESKTNDGIFKTLKFEDGREIEFDVRFLNP